jgi:DNA uptake protein ComE-like DNA-binding protein
MTVSSNHFDTTDGFHFRWLIIVFSVVFVINVGIIAWEKFYRSPLDVSNASANNLVLRFNPNTATINQLQTIPGLNSKSAQAIIQFRDDYQKSLPGQLPYKCLDDLKKAKGITKRHLAKCQNYLFFEPNR